MKIPEIPKIDTKFFESMIQISESIKNRKPFNDFQKLNDSYKSMLENNAFSNHDYLDKFNEDIERFGFERQQEFEEAKLEEKEFRDKITQAIISLENKNKKNVILWIILWIFALIGFVANIVIPILNFCEITKFKELFPLIKSLF